MSKGLSAGSVNLLLAWLAGAALPSPVLAAQSALLGFASYGASLVFFVLALRHLGTARTGAYFSTAPFAGTVLSIFLLGETVTAQLIGGGLLMLIGVAWHFYDRWTGGAYLVGFGSWGGFKPGQSWLIGFSLAAAILFYLKRQMISRKAMPLLVLMTCLFLLGLLLATSKNDRIVFPFFSLHALWHVVSAFGLMTLWAFNDVRFVKEAQDQRF